MLGHGDSDKPTRHFNIPDYAQALDDACQTLNIHRGHYVGNSVGACLATEMAASFPERVDKLVLVGLSPLEPLGGNQRVADTAADYDDKGQATPRTLEQLKDARHLRRPRQEWVDATNQTREQAGEWVRNLHQSLSYYDILSRLPLIKASSTLVMYGEKDMLRDGEELLHNNIANAARPSCPAWATFHQVEDPEGFMDAVLSFLQPRTSRKIVWTEKGQGRTAVRPCPFPHLALTGLPQFTNQRSLSRGP